jgi:hypothetical protein
LKEDDITEVMYEHEDDDVPSATVSNVHEAEEVSYTQECNDTTCNTEAAAHQLTEVIYEHDDDDIPCATEISACYTEEGMMVGQITHDVPVSMATNTHEEESNTHLLTDRYS